MNTVGNFIGFITFIIGVATIALPFLPPENICDIIDQQDTIYTIIAGSIILLSGLFNMFGNIKIK